ncbi:MAG: hypothetical protein RLZZ69_3542 [Cyanobacteriota bacterium]
MIVILCEEPSMKTTLEKLLEKFFPHKIQGYDWQVLKFQGKNDLQRNIIPTMQKWDYNQPTFLILRDADAVPTSCRAHAAYVRGMHEKMMCMDMLNKYVHVCMDT